MKQPSIVLSMPNNYRYNGKELNEDFGLNLYDYGARWYDASIGRWHSVDPLAEDYSNWTPYHYVHNNPVMLVDPTGMNADTSRIYNLSGTLLETINDSYENQEHSMSDKKHQSFYESESHTKIKNNANAKASYFRGVSEYYIGANTRSDFAKQAKLAKVDGKERGFALYYSSKSKELRVKDLTDRAYYRDKNSFILPRFIENNLKDSPSTLIGEGNFFVGFGHVQTLAGMKAQAGFGYSHALHNDARELNAPTDPDDYIDVAGRDGNHPAFISTRHGYTIFSTSEKLNPGQVYRYTGKQIISRIKH